MENRDDELTLHMGEVDFLMTRNNSSLFTFFGDLATRNHVFLVTGEESDRGVEGSYIFNWARSYESIASFMVEYDYPLRLNFTEVPECDEVAFNTALEHLDGTETEEVPEDWLNGK